MRADRRRRHRQLEPRHGGSAQSASCLSRAGKPSRLRGMGPRTTAIVIGAGPAGLLAAAHLAEAGVSTTLLEAKADFGGRSASLCRDGLFLNQGPHALYLGGEAMRELGALGIDPPGWKRAGGQ